MKLINFIPWMGNNYIHGFRGKRVLVLGESHYCASPSNASPWITREIIKDLIDPSSEHEAYKNTYTKFAKALSGQFGRMSADARAELWNRVAFYNYVQFALTGPRVSPTDTQFKLSEQAFREVMEMLQPECVFAWGHRLYNHLPGYGRQGEDVRGADGTAFETWVYPLQSGREVRVLGIDHPSVGFTPEYWHDVMMRFMEVDKSE